MKKTFKMMMTFKFWLILFALSLPVYLLSTLAAIGYGFSSETGFMVDVSWFLIAVSTLAVLSAFVGLIYVIIIRTIRLLERKTSRKWSLLIGFFIGSLLFMVAGFSLAYLGLDSRPEFTFVAVMVAIGIIMMVGFSWGINRWI